MRNTKSVAFPHVSLTRTPTHASRVAHIAVKDKGSTVVFLFGPGMERKKTSERKKRGREQLLVGVDRAAPAPHRQITLERTHHLCSFVELSHFNPRPGPFGNRLHTPPPNAEPHSRAPPSQHTDTHTHKPPSPKHSALQLSALPPLCCCSLVSGTRSHTRSHTQFHQSHPNNWPASCLSRTPGGVERMGV